MDCFFLGKIRFLLVFSVSSFFILNSIVAEAYDFDYPYLNTFESPTSVHDGVTDTDPSNDINGQQDWVLGGQWGISQDHTEWSSYSGSFHLDNNPNEIDLAGYNQGEITTLDGYIQIPLNSIQPVLSFRYILNLFGSSDIVSVEIQEEGSSDWVDVKNYFFGQNHSSYTQEEISLYEYIGKSIRVRFVQTPGLLTGVRLWVIDDIYIGEFQAKAYSYPYVNDFETPEELQQWELQGSWATSQEHNGWVNYSGQQHLDSNPNETDQYAFNEGQVATLNGFIHIPLTSTEPTLSLSALSG